MLRLYGMTWFTNYTRWLDGNRVLDVQLKGYTQMTHDLYFDKLPKLKRKAQVGTRLAALT